MSTFIVLGILLTALAVGLVVTPLLRRSAGQSAPVAATVTAIVLPAVVIMLYVTASNYDWSNPPAQVRAQGASPDGAGSMSQAVMGLEERLLSEPDDLQGWLLLGRAYTQLRQFPDAQRAYRAALELDQNSDAKLGLAETEILMDRTTLAGDAGDLVEEVLAAEPDNPKALFYGGMVARERNDLDAFRQRWERLLDMSPPEDIRKLIVDQLVRLGSDVPSVADTGGDATVPSAPDQGAGIDVRVSVADELAQNIEPGATVFLVAREPNRPGPPIAAVRENAAALPLLIRITDADAMLPGQSLSALKQIQLVARIANGGDPIAQPGDIFGDTVLPMDAAQTETVTIVINQLVE
jgi:cytochrome c-type biogenesis protein CcmH